MLTEQELTTIRTKLNREPNETELAMLDVMWSEHVAYKSSKRWFTHFFTDAEHVKLGIGEGAGLVQVDEQTLVGLALESHNHPSAIDPFNGAATGVGGIIRDIVSQGCHPIALLDSLHFGPLTDQKNKFLLEEVVRGISSYGNCVGVPNIGGEVDFHRSYSGNPLVNVMCVGEISLEQVIRSRATKPGQILVIFGSTTGRDGIQGVTFASQNLTEVSDEERGSVQIGDPLSEKIIVDIVNEFRCNGLLAGLQDLGGGGLTCASSEMVTKKGFGAQIDVSKVPLRETEMQPWEIMISESQERMLAVVDIENLDAVISLLAKHEVPYAVIGKVTEDGLYEVVNGDEAIASVPATLLVEGFPEPTRECHSPQQETKDNTTILDIKPMLLLRRALADLNVADKRWVFQQYDQHVQARTVLEPGGEAGVLQLQSGTMIAVTLNGNSSWVKASPYHGGAQVTGSAIRGLIAVGAQPLAIVDNLNFGNPENPESYNEFVEAIKGIGQVTQDFKIPVVGGNVSLYNEYSDDTGTHRIAPTPVIGALGRLVTPKPVPSVLPADGELHLFLVGNVANNLTGSVASKILQLDSDGEFNHYQPEQEHAAQDAVLQIHKEKLAETVADVSKGGLLTRLGRVAIDSDRGLDLTTPHDNEADNIRFWFSEGAPGFIIATHKEHADRIKAIARTNNTQLKAIGRTSSRQEITLDGESIPIEELNQAWTAPLPDLME